MKSILFDVDGVFLSEERCFDTSFNYRDITQK